MVDLSQESLTDALTLLWSRLDDPTNFKPTRIYIAPRYVRKAQLILNPWRGASRRKYLNKRRRS